MNAKARKRVGQLVAAMPFLALFALLAVFGVLLLERAGAIRLRRVPSPIIMNWPDERGRSIAIVNTDTTPGSFLLGYEIEEGYHPITDLTEKGFHSDGSGHPRGDEEAVWVPARSIVLKTHPKLAKNWCVVWLYDSRASVGQFEWEWNGGGRGRGFPRGQRIPVEWQHYVNGEWERAGPSRFYIAESPAWRAGIHVVEHPGVALAKRQEDWCEWYDWEGQVPVVVEVDTTTPPEIRLVDLVACDARGSIGDSCFWTYDPDMKVVDERGPKATK